MGSDEEQIKEVYARYGVALYHAQCIERSIAMLLASAYGPGPTKITKSQYDDLLGSHFQKTLGSLLNNLRKSASFPPEFDERLSETLRRRNWLTHHYFWDRAADFISQTGRRRMLSELEDATALFTSIDEVLEGICNEWGQKHGATPERMQEQLSRLMREATEEDV